MARRSQTCTAGPSLVVTTSRDPSGLKVAAPDAAQVGAFEPRDCAAGLGLDQADRLCSRPGRPPAGRRGRKQRPSPPICRASRQVPTPRAGTVRCVVISHFPSGLKTTCRALSMGSRPPCVASRMRQTWAPFVAMTAGRQPFPVRADGDSSGSRRAAPPGIVRSGVATKAKSWSARATIRPDRSSAIPQLPPAAGVARRADAEFTPVEVELDRPPPHADRAAGEQVARGLEHQVPGVADRQEGELGAAGQVPEHHALVVPTASTRPSWRIDGRS